MKGSEKQLNWANEIIARLDGVMDQIVSNIPDRYTQEQKAMMSNMIDGMRSSIHAAEYAGDVIDLFKDVKTPEDLMGVWRTTCPNTDGQRKILGR